MTTNRQEDIYTLKVALPTKEMQEAGNAVDVVIKKLELLQAQAKKPLDAPTLGKNIGTSEFKAAAGEVSNLGAVLAKLKADLAGLRASGAAIGPDMFKPAIDSVKQLGKVYSDLTDSITGKGSAFAKKNFLLTNLTASIDSTAKALQNLSSLPAVAPRAPTVSAAAPATAAQVPTGGRPAAAPVLSASTFNTIIDRAYKAIVAQAKADAKESNEIAKALHKYRQEGVQERVRSQGILNAAIKKAHDGKIARLKADEKEDYEIAKALHQYRKEGEQQQIQDQKRLNAAIKKAHEDRLAQAKIDAKEDHEIAKALHQYRKESAQQQATLNAAVQKAFQARQAQLAAAVPPPPGAIPPGGPPGQNPFGPGGGGLGTDIGVRDAVVTSVLAGQLRGIAAAATEKFREFEDVMTSVWRTAGGSKQSIDALGGVLQKVGQEVGVPVEQLGKAAEALGQVGALDLGKPTEQLNKSSPRILEAVKAVRLLGQVNIATGVSTEELGVVYGQFTKIFEDDLKRIGAALVAAGKGSGGTADAMQAVFGAMINISNQTAATTQDLLQFAQNFAGVAASAGASAEQVIAIGGTMRDLGVSAQVSGTALSRFFALMQTRSEEFGLIINKTGKEFQAAFSADAFGTFQQVLKALAERKKTDPLGISDFLSGELKLETRALNAVTKLIDGYAVLDTNLGKITDKQNENTNLLKNYGEAAENAAKFSETLSANMARVSNAFSAVVTAAGPLISTIGTIVGGVSEFVTYLSSTGMGKVLINVGLAATGIAALGTSILAVVYALNLFKASLAGSGLLTLASTLTSTGTLTAILNLGKSTASVTSIMAAGIASVKTGLLSLLSTIRTVGSAMLSFVFNPLVLAAGSVAFAFYRYSEAVADVEKAQQSAVNTAEAHTKAFKDAAAATKDFASKLQDVKALLSSTPTDTGLRELQARIRTGDDKELIDEKQLLKRIQEMDSLVTVVGAYNDAVKYGAQITERANRAAQRDIETAVNTITELSKSGQLTTVKLSDIIETDVYTNRKTIAEGAIKTLTAGIDDAVKAANLKFAKAAREASDFAMVVATPEADSQRNAAILRIAQERAGLLDDGLSTEESQRRHERSLEIYAKLSAEYKKLIAVQDQATASFTAAEASADAEVKRLKILKDTLSAVGKEANLLAGLRAKHAAQEQAKVKEINANFQKQAAGVIATGQDFGIGQELARRMTAAKEQLGTAMTALIEKTLIDPFDKAGAEAVKKYNQAFTSGLDADSEKRKEFIKLLAEDMAQEAFAGLGASLKSWSDYVITKLESTVKAAEGVLKVSAAKRDALLAASEGTLDKLKEQKFELDELAGAWETYQRGLEQISGSSTRAAFDGLRKSIADSIDAMLRLADKGGMSLGKIISFTEKATKAVRQLAFNQAYAAATQKLADETAIRNADRVIARSAKARGFDIQVQAIKASGLSERDKASSVVDVIGEMQEEVRKGRFDSATADLLTKSWEAQFKNLFQPTEDSTDETAANTKSTVEELRKIKAILEGTTEGETPGFDTGALRGEEGGDVLSKRRRVAEQLRELEEERRVQGLRTPEEAAAAAQIAEMKAKQAIFEAGVRMIQPPPLAPGQKVTDADVNALRESIKKQLPTITAGLGPELGEQFSKVIGEGYERFSERYKRMRTGEMDGGREISNLSQYLGALREDTRMQELFGTSLSKLLDNVTQNFTLSTELFTKLNNDVGGAIKIISQAHMESSKLLGTGPASPTPAASSARPVANTGAGNYGFFSGN